METQHDVKEQDLMLTYNEDENKICKYLQSIPMLFGITSCNGLSTDLCLHT